MLRQIKASNNPQALFYNLMQNDPRMREINKVIQEAGGDPKAAFYKKAQEAGINPDEILNDLK